SQEPLSRARCWKRGRNEMTCYSSRARRLVGSMAAAVLLLSAVPTGAEQKSKDPSVKLPTPPPREPGTPRWIIDHSPQEAWSGIDPARLLQLRGSVGQRGWQVPAGGYRGQAAT